MGGQPPLVTVSGLYDRTEAWREVLAVFVSLGLDVDVLSFRTGVYGNRVRLGTEQL